MGWRRYAHTPQIAKDYAKKAISELDKSDLWKARKNAVRISQAVGHLVGWNTKGERQAKNAEEQAVADAAAAAKRNEDILMGKYEAENLDPDNQARVDSYKQAQQANLRRALSTIGSADSSGRVQGETSVLSSAADLEGGIRAEWWLKAMKLHGMNEASMEWIDKMNEADRMQKLTDFSSLMESVGSVSIFYMQMQDKK